MRAESKGIKVISTLGVVLLGALLAAIIGCGEDVSSPEPQTVSSQPTYYGRVAEVLSANCVSCHTKGGIAPFPLDSPQAAIPMAPAIAYAVKEGLMPPWPPGSDSPPFKNERKLSPEERSLLVAWADGGAPLGEPSGLLKDSDGKSRPQELKPDQVLVIDPPYSPDRSRQDDYRCFLLDPKLEQDTFVTSYRVRPHQTTLVHHALLLVIGPEVVAEAEARDGTEAGPGWTCFGGPQIGGGNAGSLDLLGFWVPGASGSDFPAGTGKLLKGGSHLVMQVHYNLAVPGSTGADASSVELLLASPAAELKPIHEIPLAAPVEVLCPGLYPRNSNDPCNRDYALERSELKHAAQGIHFLCGTRPEDYLKRDNADGRAQESRCDQQLRIDALALGVTGHMHLRGSSIRIELNPNSPQVRTLLHIPDWDFEWQGQYWFQEPIPIKWGDKVRITCVYDNSGPIIGPDGSPLPPRYMTWGEGTTDEMCLGAISFVRP